MLNKVSRDGPLHNVKFTWNYENIIWGETSYSKCVRLKKTTHTFQCSIPGCFSIQNHNTRFTEMTKGLNGICIAFQYTMNNFPYEILTIFRNYGIVRKYSTLCTSRTLCSFYMYTVFWITQLFVNNWLPELESFRAINYVPEITSLL